MGGLCKKERNWHKTNYNFVHQDDMFIDIEDARDLAAYLKEDNQG